MDNMTETKREEEVKSLSSKIKQVLGLVSELELIIFEQPPQSIIETPRGISETPVLGIVNKNFNILNDVCKKLNKVIREVNLLK